MSERPDEVLGMDIRFRFPGLMMIVIVVLRARSANSRVGVGLSTFM
jgi:hypothetical protein